MKSLIAVFGVVMVLAAKDASNGGRWFEDVTLKAGVSHPHKGRIFKNAYAKIMEGFAAWGASAAAADFNGDGFEDIFVTDTAENGKNHLYRNNGDFTFTDVAEKAGVANGNDSENAAMDSLWIDYNNDGFPDLLVVRWGHSQLFENLRNGSFLDVTRRSGIGRYLNAIAATAFDYDLDGDLDIFIGSYAQPIDVFRAETPRFMAESWEEANNGGGITIFRNEGKGIFTDVTEAAGCKLSGWTLDLGHGDADNDGDDDLYIAGDFGTDRFLVNNGDGAFSDKTESAIGIDTKKGMNADWGDFDNDGFLDIYVTNITDEYIREGNFLWRNNGNLTFSDVSRETATDDTDWGWAGKFFDYDNDGWLDLYVVNGWISAGEESFIFDLFKLILQPNVDLVDVRNYPPIGNKSLDGYQKKRLFHNKNGQIFTEEAARHGLDSIKDGRGIAVADFDNDGRLDLFVANQNAQPFLYRNTLPTGARWVEFVLEGRKSNRAAVGAQARITAGGRTFLRFVDGGNGFASQSSLRIHQGLGEHDTIERVEVRWPSGAKQIFTQIRSGNIYRIVEGSPRIQEFKAKK